MITIHRLGETTAFVSASVNGLTRDFHLLDRGFAFGAFAFELPTSSTNNAFMRDRTFVLCRLELLMLGFAPLCDSCHYRRRCDIAQDLIAPLIDSMHAIAVARFGARSERWNARFCPLLALPRA